MFKNLLANFRKPQGKIGSILCGMMNVGHGKLIHSVISQLEVRPSQTVLDIGCGGGLALSLLADRGATAYGIDYSETSVHKSKAKNEAAVKAGRVHVQSMDVGELSFADDMFDLATAFETIYFWPEMEKSLKEILRCLKPGGRLAIAVEAWKEGDRLVRCPGFLRSLEMTICSVEELTALLKGCGFENVNCGINPARTWMLALADKPQPDPASEKFLN